MTVITSNGSVLQSRVLALLLRGWLEKHNKPQVKFAYLLELVRSLRYLVQRANIMTSPDDLTAMVFINAERFIASTNSIDHTLHTLLFTSFGITAKCCEDDRLFNTHIAQACGMRLEHLNKMEVLFLTQLKFEVILSPEQVSTFYADARKRWEGRPSITVHHAPFYSVSRLVSSFLHSSKDQSNSRAKPVPNRTLSTPALFQSSSPPSVKHIPSTLSSSNSSSPSSSTSTVLSSSPSTIISTSSYTPQRSQATRTVSTPNFTNAVPINSKPAPIIARPSPLVTKSASSADISVSKRIEKTSTRILNFFRSRDE